MDYGVCHFIGRGAPLAAGRRALKGMMILQHYSQLSFRPGCKMIMRNIRYVMRTHASETAFVAAHAVRFR